MYPAGALTPPLGLNAETGDEGNVEAGPDGCEPAVPGAICANRRSGSNENASTTGNHRQRAPARKQFKPWLKSNRSPNGDLIIIETEKSYRAVVPPVEVIGAG